VLREYALSRELQWVEDESNASRAQDRNYLRHEILPRIAARFPGYQTTFARSARHCAQAAQLLDELAALDWAAASEGGRLRVERLAALSPARRKNLLRYCLARSGAPIPASEQLEQMLAQILGARSDAQVCVNWSGHTIARYHDLLHVQRAAPAAAPFALTWKGEEELRHPNMPGALIFAPVSGQGVALEKLARAPVTIRQRGGGEKFRPDCKRPRRTLKNLLQENGIPPWQRQRMPLMYCGEELVWVPGIGIDCSFQAGAAERGIEVTWQVA
jgi:tRNA(Ile)-lysidine synthase